MSHKIIVARVSNVTPILGADYIHEGSVLGERVVISKTVVTGDVGLFFPVDLQLSNMYCYENNLYHDKALNKDVTKSGFFDKNRRVRAQTFKGVKSCGLFMPLESVSFTGAWLAETDEGLAFDELNGHKLVQKYISEASKVKGQANQAKAVKKNFAPFFAKHVDSEQFRHYAERIQKGSLLHFHSKKHGTSFRVAHTKVSVSLTWWQKLVNKLAPVFPDWKWDYVVGTRNVVLQDNKKEGWHGSEQFRFDVFESIKPHLTEGLQVFGEIVGFVNGKPIMPVHEISKLKDKAFTKKYGSTITYSYGCKEHEFKFHIYRVANTLEDGTLQDLSQRQLEAWCEQRGLPCTLEVAPPLLYTGDEEGLRALVEALTERPECLTEDFTNPSQVSEGIVLRIDNGGLTPTFMKNKSFAFKVMEGQEMVENIEDCS